MPLLVGNGAAILHDPAGNEPPDSDERRAAFLHDNRNSLDTPETSQMTTEKKKGGFLRQIRSHLFRPMNRASSGFASLLGIRNPPTVPTPIPSSNVSYPALPVASSSQGRSGKHAQATVQHDHKITSTTSARAPSQSSAWFQRPHNDGRQGMRSRKYSSRVQRKKFVPIDVTASRVTPSHLSLRRTWSAPAALRRANLRAPSHSSRRNSTVSLTVHRGPFRSGRRRDRTRSISRQSSATSQIQAETRPERRGSQSRSTFALQSLLPNDFRFRILVVGKRDCGKSSLIRTIFKADMSVSTLSGFFLNNSCVL
ncbi:hypothetical protein BGY98DRAFT_983340 [Russula aff. rugulosa BPL654]|nr:hypothetical protein BGY98DRAFT_983340 [Russula aff. rugulosa BPL654]